jgi:hypothetical protein
LESLNGSLFLVISAAMKPHDISLDNGPPYRNWALLGLDAVALGANFL